MSRAQNHEFQEWWNKQKEKNHELFVENNNNNNNNHNKNSNGFLTVEIRSPTTTDPTVEKERTRSARQLSWLWLLKFQQLANSLAWITNASIYLLRTANRRIASPDSPSDSATSKLYRAIKVFLILVILLLCFELQSLANMCIVLFLIQSVDRVVLMFGCFWIKFRRLKPKASVQYLDGQNVEDYPMVLIQIPMCNEREVYQQSIAAVCVMDWPKERMLVQVLDDSDELDVQLLIKAEVQKWQQRGVRIIYRHRLMRTGYKAGNLKSAMGCDYVKDYEFVTIFDADFQPGPDFLKKTVPYFKGNDDLALVQTRWAFVNKDENLLTRLQNINLSFHFEVEQQVNDMFINFFGFNGTAGVWRIKALEECGGWLERTTVEDMDIAVRAHLHGRKFIYLNDVKVHDVLPFAEFQVAEGYENPNAKQSKSSEGNETENGYVKTEEEAKGSNSNAGDEKQNKNSTKPPEPPKDYIHVRARRGQATDSHSLSERVRREKISERMKRLQDLVPGCNKVPGKALMLDEIINYVQSSQRQVEFLSMKLASVNTRLDFNMDSLMSKDIFQSSNPLPRPILPFENENGYVKAEEEAKGSNSNAGDEKQNKNSTKPPEPPKDYIHVRARRGQVTDSHSLAERVRREKISERMKLLQDLVPGCNKVTGNALMLDEIINYVQSLQRQVEFLSMKLASVNTRLDFNMDSLMSKDALYMSLLKEISM